MTNRPKALQDPAAQVLRDPKKEDALFTSKEEPPFWNHRPSVCALADEYNDKVKCGYLKMEVLGDDGKIRKVPLPK